VSAAFVGSFAAGLFTRQLHLGALVAEAHPAWRGLPTAHVEAACASGASAVFAGIDRLLAESVMGGASSGRRGCVLVVGAEQQKTMPPREVGDVMGAAGDFAAERAAYGEFPIPKAFGRIARAYVETATDPAAAADALAEVAVKNRAHAQHNPQSQMRGKPLDAGLARTVCEANPLVAEPLRVSDCSPITDGAAAVVLATDDFASARRLTGGVRVLGVGRSTDRLALEGKEVPRFPVAARAVRDALAMAEAAPGDLGGVEVHDCFSVTELVACELLGLAGPGEGWRLVRDGATRLGGKVPVNAGGGLIGDGHPVGATGVRQLHECRLQLLGRAGARQIRGVRLMAAWNMGGTFATSCCTVLGND
jgi:acetyl-CoA C-acetyltransferase